MITVNNISEWAERYLNQELSGQEQAQLMQAVKADPDLNLHFKQAITIIKAFHSGAERNAVKDMIRSVGAEVKTAAAGNDGQEPVTAPARILPFRKYLRTISAAAALILVSSLVTMTLVSKKSGKVDATQYTLLRREIETIKHSQSKIIDSLNKEKKEATNAEDPVSYGGTGFALTNDGYIATNYHVVKDANAIYIQTNKGENLKAYIFAMEPSTDVAILKVEDKSFRFGKTPLPYNIAKAQSGLGQRVFTIGYPKDDVVYNEGYVSSENGYQGDTNSYQLEITANPGQSGAPVLDKYGTVIALITGKQSNTTGTTYAIHSGALLELIHSLPKAANIRLNEGNKLNKLERTEQVKKVRDYICSVKVN
ncbi:S1 family peptidase [Taibaiella chishuiensis]|uniref:Trypsin-like peptidase n=1 Tax=Taibaiella chishuiensis TaxID=1434707 RepID=A0A2P8DBC5_9BACT|nr:serine protease [Taibaiella chishuiensis]PSK94495.1 trypsin-like peptidase [Taibaiella chishuiensis]